MYQFDFTEKVSGKTFTATRTMQTNGTMAYAISWVEDGIFKVEIFSIREVEFKLKTGVWNALGTLEQVKNEIKNMKAEKVEIIVSESETNLYDTIINVLCDNGRGCYFEMGKKESYQDAVKRANSLYTELKYVKARLEINT